MSNAYQEAGVDIHKGYEAVERMKKHVARTMRPEVMNQLGSFGALFKPNFAEMDQPVLVSGTDGVGTKILLAQQSGNLNSVGIDCVAMCVNDILAQGGEPLFFLDYLAVGQNNPEKIEQIVAGVAEGCVQAQAALIGGETAEMPDLYSRDEFDLAGFAVGVVDQSKMLDGTKVQAGDVLIGLPSSGVHSNGFSLVRKIFFADNAWSFDHALPSGQKLIDALLTPTKIYVQEVAPLIRENLVSGISHITGGGFYENVPRMFGDNLMAVVDVTKWEVPEIFTVMQELAGIETDEMFNVFNMGIGMILAVRPENVETVLAKLETAYQIGTIQTKTTDSVRIEGI